MVKCARTRNSERESKGQERILQNCFQVFFLSEVDCRLFAQVEDSNRLKSTLINPASA